MVLDESLLHVRRDRFPAPAGFARSAKRRELLRTLQALTAFTTFDSIAGLRRAPRHATPTITELVFSALASAGLLDGE